MLLLSTHLAADFDALASVLAARRLYPEGKIFFPGSREESVREMLASGLVGFEELRQRQIDPEEIECVVLLDVRQADRIGILAEWLRDRPEIEVVAYDHHPDTPTDVPAAGGIVDAGVGATSTLMVEELDRRGLTPTPAEATVLAMGIFEDTGSLAYPTASPRDFRAAARLVELGADLEEVRRFAVHRLDARHLDILHRMTRELHVFRVHDHRVGIVTLELGDFVEELAPLVNRCLEIFELPLLFALFGETDRVTVIARGHVPEVHLGRLLEAFAAGGGHETAASARVKDTTALELREKLLAHLERVLPPAVLARDLMVEGFFRLAAETPVERAKELLVERRVNAAPVFGAAGEGRTGEEGEVGPDGTGAPEPVPIGAVTRQLLDAALAHGLGERPVERVMERHLEWVPPGTGAEEVARRFLGRHPRFVLVGDATRGRVDGLVTRMDVLRHLYGRLAAVEERVDRRAREERAHRIDVTRRLREGLAPAVTERVEAARAVSAETGVAVYVVGGLVRDLFLGRENRDLDLVVEGDGIAFARRLAAALGGHAHTHEAFKTAVVVDEEGFHVDVATARSEFYRAPAALPEVESSTLRQDLFRRDFTVNTLAVRLGPKGSPQLVDFFGGLRDLENRTLRVLHSLSFVDDPTRVLRAVRLELRLGLAMSAETRHLVRVALEEGVFDRLSGSRLREELFLLLAEPAIALRGLDRLAELGILGVLHPLLGESEPDGGSGRETHDSDPPGLPEALRERSSEVRAAWDWYRLEGVEEPPVAFERLLLLALAWDLPRRERERLAERLLLAGEAAELLAGVGERLEAARRVIGGDDGGSGEGGRGEGSAGKGPSEAGGPGGGRAPAAAGPATAGEAAAAGPAPHRVSAALAPLAGEELLLLMAVGDETERAWVRRELVEMRPFTLAVRGGDLVAAGVEPGPAIGRALAATRDARLDGRIGEAEERKFALAAARREEAGAGPGPQTGPAAEARQEEAGAGAGTEAEAS